MLIFFDKIDNYMDYSKIKNLMTEKNISIKELSEKIGITEGGFHQTFRNKSLKVDTLEKIADVLGVSICAFFVESPENDNLVKSKELSDLKINNMYLNEFKEDSILILVSIIHNFVSVYEIEEFLEYFFGLGVKKNRINTTLNDLLRRKKNDPFYKVKKAVYCMLIEQLFNNYEDYNIKQLEKIHEIVFYIPKYFPYVSLSNKYELMRKDALKNADKILLLENKKKMQEEEKNKKKSFWDIFDNII